MLSQSSLLCQQVVVYCHSLLISPWASASLRLQNEPIRCQIVHLLLQLSPLSSLTCTPVYGRNVALSLQSAVCEWFFKEILPMEIPAESCLYYFILYFINITHWMKTAGKIPASQEIVYLKKVHFALTWYFSSECGSK